MMELMLQQTSTLIKKMHLVNHQTMAIVNQSAKALIRLQLGKFQLVKSNKTKVVSPICSRVEVSN